MASGSVSCGKTFARDDEGCGVRSHVEEVICDNIKSQQSPLTKAVVAESQYAKGDGKNNESDYLKGLAANAVNC